MNNEFEIRHKNSMPVRHGLGRRLQSQEPRTFGFVGNVPQALPIEARRQLEKHTVNPSAYEGRMPWIAASYMLEKRPVVIMHEQPLQAELEILDEVCSKIGIPTPDIVVSEKPFDYTEKSIRKATKIGNEDIFFHPFIGTHEFGAISNALPDSTPFNDKAEMRRLMKSNGLRGYVIPGEEVFYDSQYGAITLLRNVKEAVESSGHDKLRVKLGDTASGMCTVVVDRRKFETDSNYRLETLRKIRDFTRNEAGNFVVEQELERADDWVDYGTRGYVDYQGGFTATSLAMQITDSSGVYLGAVVTTPDNGTWIGLSDQEAGDMLDTTSKLADAVYEKGHRGPINPDMFRRKPRLVAKPGGENEGVHPSLTHDFNFRDGGTSASGFIAEAVYPSKTGMDVDLTMQTERMLSEKELNNMVRGCWNDENILIYATTFLRHPKQTEDGRFSYTVKTIAEPSRPVADLDIRDEELNNLVVRLNTNSYGTFSFNMI
jgi:hypothetical protein